MKRFLGALLLFAFSQAEAFTYDTSGCPTGSYQTQRVRIAPSSPIEGQTITVCMLDYVYADRVTVAQTGNRIRITIYDNGWSWSPNPPIMIVQTLNPLPPGSYFIDAFVDADFHDPSYPRAIATYVALEVGDSVSVPILGIPAYLILVAMLTLAGVLHKSFGKT